MSDEWDEVEDAEWSEFDEKVPSRVWWEIGVA